MVASIAAHTIDGLLVDELACPHALPNRALDLYRLLSGCLGWSRTVGRLALPVVNESAKREGSVALD